MKEGPKYLKDCRKNMENLLKTAQENQNRSSKRMVLRHKNKHPPSEYEKGDTVTVKITKSDKKIKDKGKTFVTSKRGVVQQSENRNKVEYEIDKDTRYTWFPVSMITSAIREEEIKRQVKAKKERSQRITFKGRKKDRYLC